MPASKEVDKCRLCDGSLKSFFDAGEVPVANAFLAEGKAPNFPLHVKTCNTCGQTQLGHDFDPKEIFEHYLYETSKGLESHFKQYALDVTRQLGLGEFDQVIEIGGNSGLLCREFKQLGLEVTNIEPAANIAEISTRNGIRTYNNFFGKEFATQYLNFNPKAKLVVSNNCLAHIPNLTDVFDGIFEILEDDGTLVFENAYWLDTLKNNDLGQIYLEHVFYHLVGPLFRYFHLRGATLYRVEFNDIQCGSCRFFVKKGDVPMETSVYDAIVKEMEYINSEEYRKFKLNVLDLGEEVRGYLNSCVENEGKKVALVGVPAKAALILYYFGISKYFFAAFDDAPLKWGKKVPGTDIIIRPMKELKDSGADVGFIGAYNLKDVIIKNNPEFKGKWYCPLPEPKEL